MRKVSSFVFPNNKRELAVFYATKRQLKKRKVHVHDAIALRVDAQDGEKARTLFMRPDEALLIARLLIDAVYQTTKAYKLGVKREPKITVEG